MNINRSNSIIVISVFGVLVLLSSCVSKKKYLEMEGYKNRAEARVVELTKDVANLKEEFDSYNNQFQYSNAEKDMMVDSLSKVIIGLNSEIVSTSENVEDQVFSFQVEKRRLNQLLADKDREIRRLQRSSDALKIKVDDLQTKIVDINLDLRSAQNQNNSTEREVEQKEREIEQLKGKLNKQVDQLNSLKKDLASKDEKIEALSNQVKLLKSQFGQ